MSAKLYLPPSANEAYVELFSFDESYVQRLRAGDALTEQHFVSYFSGLLLIKLRARLLSAEDVDDLRQETFARVLAALRTEDGIRQPESLGAFVNSVCNNVLLEFYRSSSRDRPLDPPESAESVLDLDGLLVAKQTKERVREILAQLPEKDGRLLRAIFLEQKHRDQVCRDFGVDRDYLRVLLHRAKDKFKSCYLKSELHVHRRVADKETR